MTDKFYYKIINNTTNKTDFYVSVDLPVKPEKLCEILCLNGYRAESTTKEEYENNTEEVEEVGVNNV